MSRQIPHALARARAGVSGRVAQIVHGDFMLALLVRFNIFTHLHEINDEHDRHGNYRRKENESGSKVHTLCREALH